MGTKVFRWSDRNSLQDVLSAQNSGDANKCRSGLTVEKFIGNKNPLMCLNGLILSEKDEKGLMNLWENSRADVSQILNSEPMVGGPIKAHVLIHDLTINRKMGFYKVLIRSYYDNQFNNVTPTKNVTSKIKDPTVELHNVNELENFRI